MRWYGDLKWLVGTVDNVVVEFHLDIVAIAVHAAIVLEDVVSDDLCRATWGSTAITVEEYASSIIVAVVVLDSAGPFISPIAVECLAVNIRHEGVMNHITAHHCVFASQHPDTGEVAACVWVFSIAEESSDVGLQQGGITVGHHDTVTANVGDVVSPNVSSDAAVIHLPDTHLDAATSAVVYLIVVDSNVVIATGACGPIHENTRRSDVCSGLGGLVRLAGHIVHRNIMNVETVMNGAVI
ncbi:uncharacterized protein N7498_002451 [Penicillium cinerascens]|uniref:Uncharacterized protein n=1 Tax=Penicillium cinerascens TaxID=70096 RepID=A0A9W9NA49_9EURO|nr:uncharacterized protein N7498_002451 [Penicillium cinerascens]KAJ5216044.1 hypothetical protein N7498_002451 [Penicillium cinerascens]